MTLVPREASSQLPGKMHALDYDIWLQQPGSFALGVVAAPSLGTARKGGFRYAVAIDDATPLVAPKLLGHPA